LAEANVLPDTDLEYFGANGERLQMMFNFQVNQTLFYALATADNRPLAKALKANQASCWDRPVGSVFAKSRRTGPRAIKRRTTASCVRCVRA
jgi:hypothetical protein